MIKEHSACVMIAWLLIYYILLERLLQMACCIECSVNHSNHLFNPLYIPSLGISSTPVDTTPGQFYILYISLSIPTIRITSSLQFLHLWLPTKHIWRWLWVQDGMTYKPLISWAVYLKLFINNVSKLYFIFSKQKFEFFINVPKIYART